MASSSGGGNMKPMELQHMIAGTAGGLVSTVALYPLELIKTRMQVSDVRIAAPGRLASGSAAMSSSVVRAHAMAGPYSSLYSSARTVLKQEGLAGFYKGVVPAVVASAGSWGAYFYLYEYSKKRKLRYNRQHGIDSGGKLGVTDHLLSGVEAGVTLVFAFNPLWLIKTRLALQGACLGDQGGLAAQPQYSGAYHAFRTIIREEGVAGLYKGILPALFLTSHGAVQFATYEKLKVLSEVHLSQESRESAPWAVAVLCGGVSKIIASTVTYPYQVIKSRLQQRDELVASPSSGAPNKGVVSPATATTTTTILKPRYEGTADCVRKIWRQEGLAGYFRGVVPNALKVAPSAALTFVVYEETLRALARR